MARRTLTDEVKLKIVSLVDQAVKASDEYISDRLKDWEDSEKLIQSYQPKAKAERQRNDAQEKDGFTQLKIPYVYGLLMAQHTYLCSVFLGKSQVFQFVGANAKGQNEVTEVETIVDHQVRNGGMLASLYVALYDLLLYGVMAQFYTWEDNVTYLTTYVEEPVQVEGVPVMEDGVPKTEEKEVIQEFPGYKGGSLINTKPRNLIIDPTVGFVNYQKGQFLGRRYQEKVDILQQRERQGLYFGTDKLSADYGKDHTSGGDNPALHNTAEPQEVTSLDGKAMKGFANVREVYMWIVPSEIGLGKNTNPEIWVFLVANRTHLIACEPAGWMHGQFPGFIGVAEYDGYTLSSRGTPEIGKPLNDTMNWLLNTHMYNVEKSVNNEYIYDPSMINTRDFLDPLPGKRIRIRPEGYGKDIRTFIHQFTQTDFTRQNVADIALVESLFQRVFGVNEQMLGALTSGGRKTATEVRSAAGFALNRLKVLSEWLGATWFNPLGKVILASSRQMYTQEDKFSILQTASNQMRDFTVDEITGNFDLIPVDGSIPVDRMAQVAMLTEVLTAMQSMPAIAGRYDVASFFEYIIKLMGIKNIDQFKITDPAKVQQEAALGAQLTGVQNGNTGTNAGTTGVGSSVIESAAGI